MGTTRTLFLELSFRIRRLLLRIFRRRVWLELERFDLGSLINVYLGFNANSDLQDRLDKLESLKSRTEAVLRRYDPRSYREFESLTFRVNNTRALTEDLCNACGILHRGLVRAQNALSRLDAFRAFARCVSRKTPR